MNLLYMITRLKKTKKCDRCALNYAIKMDECPHCSHLSDGRELSDLLDFKQQQAEANSRLGMTFIAISVVLIIGLAVVQIV